MKSVDFLQILRNCLSGNSRFRLVAAVCLALVILCIMRIVRSETSSTVNRSHSSMLIAENPSSPGKNGPAALSPPPGVAISTAKVGAGPQEMVKQKRAASNAEIRQLLNRARHGVISIDGAASGLEVNRGATHFMQNPEQGLTARFGAGGVRLESGKGESWLVELSYSGAGKDSTMQADASKLSIHHPDGVVEWYDNSSKGIEHGFTLSTRTIHTGLRDIRISIDGMNARQSGGDVVWCLPEGGDVLSYTGLHVKDATGAALAA